MTEAVNWHEVRTILDALYRGTDRLEVLFPGRKFTLDGHLVGSIGEVIAAYMFDLDLFRGSNKCHDAKARDGRHIEVKFTQGNSVAIRHEPEHLLVLQRSRGKSVQVIYNGPGASVWAQAGKAQSNGQRPISLSRLHSLNEGIADFLRLKQRGCSDMTADFAALRQMC